MASARSGQVETIRYMNDPSNCLYGRFAMMAFPARVVGPIVADRFGPSVGSIETLEFPGKNFKNLASTVRAYFFCERRTEPLVIHWTSSLSVYDKIPRSVIPYSIFSRALRSLIKHSFGEMME